jgi:hypothetical protein
MHNTQDDKIYIYNNNQFRPSSTRPSSGFTYRFRSILYYQYNTKAFDRHNEDKYVEDWRNDNTKDMKGNATAQMDITF